MQVNRAERRPPHHILLGAGWMPSGAGDAVEVLANPGDIVIVVGPNGSGKSVLLGSIAAAADDFRGQSLLVSESALDVVSSHTADVGAALLVANSASDEDMVLHRYGVERQQQIATLSHGERQRLLVAIAASSRAALVLLDDPSAHLDSDGLDLLEEAIVRTSQDARITIVATTDPELVLRFPEARLYTLVDGQLFERRAGR